MQMPPTLLEACCNSKVTRWWLPIPRRRPWRSSPNYKPEIVLLDIGLPEIDGYEIARRIRASPDHRHVRLIALTGYGQTDDRQRARASGFDAHLVKPVEFAALQRVLAAQRSTSTE